MLGDRFTSRAYTRMIAWVRRAARPSLPVLVTGESGSGKESVARALHAWSPRAAGPFVALNCGAVAASLVEAELFGVRRGAFTGAEQDRPGLFRAADGGTLLLDEVGEMPPAAQVPLLRVLESRRVRPVGATVEHPIDVRVVAATHRDLELAVARGDFRDDLYHRLAVLRVDVPPLRVRLDDLEALVESLTPRLSRETGFGRVALRPDGWDALRAHDWPGNVRELHAALARAMLRSDGGRLGAHDLDLPPRRLPVATGLEQRMVESALAESDGRISSAANRIGWTRQKLYRRMAALGVEPERFRDGPA